MRYLLIFFILIGCAQSGDEDTTCWAHTAADIIYANELDEGRYVYQELVNHFGDGPNYVYKALVWWIGDKSLITVKDDDIDNVVFDAFENGIKAIGFMIPGSPYNHYLTAYKYSDIEGYHIIRVVYI